MRLISVAIIGSWLLFPTATPVPLRAASGPAVLENDLCRVEIDPDTGVIRRIFDKTGKAEFISEPRLADNFRLLAPLPDLEGNYIFGNEQRLSSLLREPDAMTLQWKSPLTNDRGEFDIRVSMRISLRKQAVEFRLKVENHTQRIVAEVWYPILGGITGIGDRADTEEMIPYRGWSTGTNLFREFTPMSGLGIPYPEAFWSYPHPMTMTWMDIYNKKRNQGAYFAIHDPVSRYKALRFELHPGIANRKDGNWPRRDEVGSLPAGLMAHWTLFPYIAPGETLEGPPALIQFHDGDWHAAAAIYRNWFQSTFPIADPRKNWMYDQMGFQDGMFLLPEGNINWRFKDIGRWARDALSYGVSSVLISGWNVGGHDAGYPDYTPDPRLGTWDELAASIRECHNIGVKVFFFVNVQPVDSQTDWYRWTLAEYRVMDRWGVSNQYGWGMGSLGARLGFAKRPLVAASSGIPEYRKIIVRQMEELARIGADGVHIDKLCPAGMNFNPKLTVSPDKAISEGQLNAVNEIQRACGAIRSDFAVSAECPWDRLLEFTGVGWAWHPVAQEHTPAFKFTFQQYLPTVTVTQPFDYTAVNNAVRYGYQIFVGPGNYTKSMAYQPFQPLSRYIQDVIRIRKELKETIYRGEFMDTLEARVDPETGTGYSLFRNWASKKRACVFVNYTQGPRKISLRGFGDGADGSVRIYEPFRAAKAGRLPVNITLSGERLAIVIEE